MSDLRETAHQLARAHQNVSETVSCPGTVLEARTYTVHDKSFLFVGMADPTVLRFKLGRSAADAKRAGVDVGMGGWSKVVLPVSRPAPPSLPDWIAESYALAAAPAVAPRPTVPWGAEPRGTSKPTPPKQAARAGAGAPKIGAAPSKSGVNGAAVRSAGANPRASAKAPPAVAAKTKAAAASKTATAKPAPAKAARATPATKKTAKAPKAGAKKAPARNAGKKAAKRAATKAAKPARR